MGGVSVGRDLEVPRKGTGKSVLGTCIGELRSDGGSWDMVWVEWAGALTFSKLGVNLGGRSDARHAGHPWECHGVGHCQSGQQEKTRHAWRTCGSSWVR